MLSTHTHNLLHTILCTRSPSTVVDLISHSVGLSSCSPEQRYKDVHNVYPSSCSPEQRLKDVHNVYPWHCLVPFLNSFPASLPSDATVGSVSTSAVPLQSVQSTFSVKVPESSRPLSLNARDEGMHGGVDAWEKCF